MCQQFWVNGVISRCSSGLYQLQSIVYLRCRERRWGAVFRRVRVNCLSLARSSNFLLAGALATWKRWEATALALTGGWLFLGGFWAEPRWQMRAQLFRLDRVKSICEMWTPPSVSAAMRRETIRWSATSVSPDSSYCFSRASHSVSNHGI